VAGGLLGAATTASAQGAPPGFFQIPGTTTALLITGQVGTRAVWDSVSAPDYPAFMATDSDILIPLFIPASVNTTGTNNAKGSFHFTTRDFSFGFITSTPTAWGPMETVLIMGAGSNLNDPGPVGKSFQNVGVVVAFGTLGPWMAGMNGSLIGDEQATPDTMGEPLAIPGQLGGLQPSVRYTWKGPGGWSLAGSLEEPFTSGVANDPVGNFPNQLLPFGAPTFGGQWSPATPFSTGTIGSRTTWPDVILKVRLDQPWGHIALAGLVHDMLVDCQVNCVSPFGNGTMPNYNKVGYGFNLTGHINTWGKDTLKGGVFAGKGIDHYIGDSGNAGIQIGTGPQCNGGAPGWCPNAYAPVEWGIYAAYQHFWTDALRSTLGAGYNHVSIDRNLFANSPTSGVVLGNVFQTTHWSIAANLVWSPVPKVDLGVEYIYYHINFASEGVGNSTAGHDHRIEAESIFHF
jgi:hypothetical protein